MRLKSTFPSTRNHTRKEHHSKRSSRNIRERDYFPRHSGVQRRKIILDIKTHYKPTETFQYTHFNLCHPPGVKNAFIKGEAMRLLRTNSSKTTFGECFVKFKQRLRRRGYPKTIIERSLSGVNFPARPSALTQKKKANESILPFVTTEHPAVSNLKQTLMEQWSLIQNQPLLKTICLKFPIISYERGKSLVKVTLVRSKI